MALAYLASVFERILVELQPPGTTEDLDELRQAFFDRKWAWSTYKWAWP